MFLNRSMTMATRTRFFLLLPALLMVLQAAWGQPSTNPGRVHFIRAADMAADPARQEELRAAPAWQTFKSAHPRWTVEFDQGSGKPHRAFGPAIATVGADPVQRAWQFMDQHLAPFGIPMQELQHRATNTTGKYHYVHFDQVHQGVSVLKGQLLVKMDLQGRVVLFGLDVHDDIALDMAPTLTAEQAMAIAAEGLGPVEATIPQGLRCLPIPRVRHTEHRLVHEVMVHTRQHGRPGHYRCWVDAHSGELLYRWDEVLDGCHGHDRPHGDDGGDNGADASVQATVLPNGPLAATEVVGLPDLRLTINGQFLFTDGEGELLSGIPGPVDAVVQLRGRWANVTTNNSMPSFTTTLQEGGNTLDFDPHANMRQRSAYHSVNRIHAHMKAQLPDLTGMDFVLPTIVDLAGGSCNAFYDGASISFYAAGNGCRSMALMHDVVYHEYGHGINDRYYQSFGGNIFNAALNEGYADLWALSLTTDPVFGRGYIQANDNSFIRRYDVNPKVYPVDLVGQMHADGEIICGAWWDTHILLGNDVQGMLDLFAEAYAGLQGTAFNGQEGQVFRDVLIDALQADDDDSDITNGTPNGVAIVQAFAQHGITLLSNAEIQHTPILAADADTSIPILAAVNVFFPYDQYMAGVRVFQRINGGTDWTSTAMTPLAGGVYTTDLPPQPAATLIAYYLGVEDVLGGLGGVRPMAANKPDPNLPHFILVGFTLEATEDADLLHELGTWTTGIPQDNATSGLWEQNVPIPSFSGANGTGVMVQPGFQHTPGGEFCWVTGNALSPLAPMGEADVDGGSTTVMSDLLDLSGYDTPTLTYWRWYVNNPPGGSNPNDDHWQVFLSNDGGGSWVPVEETRTSDRSWRRMAFRVEDVLPITATMRIKFVASDSIRPGAHLEGASLVEAALDDIQLWQAGAPTVGVDERPVVIASLFPDPAQAEVNVLLAAHGVRGLQVEVVDIAGRVVLRPAAMDLASHGHQRINVRSLATGTYVLRIHWEGGRTARRFSVLR
jgi:hypothetical protein